MLNRTSSTRTASGSVGISGTRMSRTLEGRCVATIVLISPKREASRDASNAEIPAKMFAQKKIDPERGGVHAEPQEEPIRGEALDDEAASERVQREQGRQLHHDVARSVESGNGWRTSLATTSSRRVWSPPSAGDSRENKAARVTPSAA